MGGSKAAPLFRLHVQEHRMINLLKCVKHLDQGGDIVPVDRTEIRDAELLENLGALQGGFNAVFDALQGFANGVAEIGQAADK